MANLLHAASIEGAVEPQVINVTCTTAKPLKQGQHIITLKVNYIGSQGCESKSLTAAASVHVLFLRLLPPATILPVCQPQNQSQPVQVDKVFAYQLEGTLDDNLTAVKGLFAPPVVEASAGSLTCKAKRTGVIDLVCNSILEC